MAATSTERTPLLEDQDATLIQEKKESISDLKPYMGSILATFYMVIMSGLNDGSLGAIIPRLKEYYDVPNETVSIFFLCAAFGFFGSAALNGTLVYHFGQLKTIYIGAFTMFSAYLFLMMGLPFPVMGFLLICVGSGIALMNSAGNVYLASLPNATVVLNMYHALYGLGAMISPLVATLLLQHGNSWKVMYICLGVFAFFNLIFITLGFWSVNFESGDDNSEENTEEGEDGNPVKLNHSQLTKAAIFNRMTLVGALYILLYVGDEVVPGGWGYTFLTEGRLGDKIEMGRVVSAYWAGLAIGRIALGYLTSRFGEKLMITLFTLLIICSFITMMVSSDIVINSTAYISAGFLLGPMFPTIISITSKVLPRKYHATSIGFMSALGSGGAALFPFITGQIAGKYGILIMPGVCASLTVIMLILWAFIPSDKPFFGACK